MRSEWRRSGNEKKDSRKEKKERKRKREEMGEGKGEGRVSNKDGKEGEETRGE